MSKFEVVVVPVELEKHPNADSLSIVKVFDGYNCCVRTEDWIGIDKAAYIPPDSIVPNIPEFSFLDGHLKIKARKLRGIESFGLLFPAPSGSNIGDDVAEILGIVHYEPEMNALLKQGEMSTWPPYPGKDYDMESWQKYRNEFIDGEDVIITEKLHGTNARFTFQDNTLWCGSHHTWKKPGDNLYFDAANKFAPWVKELCQVNPGAIFFGEIYGAVQKGFNYGRSQSDPYQLRIFDIFKENNFLDYDVVKDIAEEYLVPIVYRGPYSHEVVTEHTNGKSLVLGASHIREGVVIKPTKEKFSGRLHGRLILKSVSIDYLEGKKNGKK